MRRLCIVPVLALLLSCTPKSQEAEYWQMRGLVLSTKELAEVDWPALAARSGINTIGTHITPSEVLAFLESPEGRRFTKDCRRYGITVEHQLHAMAELLPRELFAEDSTMFRMDGNGRRTPDANLCVHSAKALEIVAQNAAALAKKLKPDNHRYYFWLDDNLPVCACPLCREYLPSEQALIAENAMLREILKVDSRARLAHLAYSSFLEPPRKVTPDEGIFLEFAPIYRSWDEPLYHEDVLCPRGYPVSNGDNLRALEANLEVFPAEDAVVLEYWLDASLFSRWKRPSVELPWREDVCRSDLATYASYGLRNVTSFAVYMDAEYFSRFPSTAPVEEYGRLLGGQKNIRGLHEWWQGLVDSTSVSIFRDSSQIHFIFDVRDSTPVFNDDPDEMSVNPCDRAEIFISCDPQMQRYYCFEIDPQGKTMDYSCSFYRKYDYPWSGEQNVQARPVEGGYHVEAAFSCDYLRRLGLLQDDGSLLIGFYRGDAFRPGEITWYSAVNPGTPEPDFHVPESLFILK